MSTDRFKIATFNANSIRARLHILVPWLEANWPDMLCVQETKVQDPDFPLSPFEDLGYHVTFRGEKKYNGVALLSLEPVQDVRAGFTDGGPADEARLLRCRCRGVEVVNTYVPQGSALDSPKYAYKLAWFARLRALFEANYDPSSPVIWCGDLNVAPEDRDVYDPERLRGHVCFNPDVTATFDEVRRWGFVDVFRRHRDEPDQFTYFDYRIRGGLSGGVGWRIDHILATATLAERSVDAWIDLEPRRQEKPSDHTFLVAEFEL